MTEALSMTGVPALAGEESSVRRAVQVIGELLTGSVPERTTAEGFLFAHLGRFGADVVCETRRLSPIGHITAGLALADLIDRFAPPIGPGDNDEPPMWRRVDVGDRVVSPPSAMSVFFAGGQLCAVPVVVRLSEAYAFHDDPQLQIFGAPSDRQHLEGSLDAILADGDGALNLFRGRSLKATDRNGLAFDVVSLPAITRADVVVPQHVWDEIDLNVASVTSQRGLMASLGLGVRRGILLAGPPGVGKTIISQVVARELVGDFTVITADARSSRTALAAIYREAAQLGPTVVVLEDLDLLVGDRRGRRLGSEPTTLSEFLAAMDSEPDKPILTLASTNDLAALDAAAIRSARFDAIIEIDYPDRASAARILARYLVGVPGSEHVDSAAVAHFFGPEVSGADIREVVRRTVLATGVVTEPALINTVQSGRFKVEVPDGNYL